MTKALLKLLTIRTATCNMITILPTAITTKRHAVYLRHLETLPSNDHCSAPTKHRIFDAGCGTGLVTEVLVNSNEYNRQDLEETTAKRCSS